MERFIFEIKLYKVRINKRPQCGRCQISQSFRILDQFEGTCIYRVWLTSNAKRSRAAPWCNSMLVAVAVRDTLTVTRVVVAHVCGNGYGGDGYENGLGNLAEFRADGDVASTARWNINGRKASQRSILGPSRAIILFSAGVHVRHVPGGIIPVVDLAEKILPSVTTNAR